jgi:dihydrofolate reductase
MAMSADGFISKTSDEAPWSDTVWDEYFKTVKQFGNMILGRRTYELMKAEDEFTSLGDPFVVVLYGSPAPGVSTANSPADALVKMKQKGFDKIYLGGGAKANGAFLKAELIDELVLDVESFIFGEGVPLFAGSDLPDLKLELIETKQLGPQTVRLHYKVIR